MDGFEALVRAEFEPLQYALFFGCLLLFGGLETILSRAPAPAARQQRWPANAALMLLNVLLLGVMPLSGVAAADMALAQDWGLFNLIEIPGAVLLVLGFLLRSLLSYAIHIAMHQVPLLWRVHRVHHSDPRLDVSTTVRFHPLEFVISTPILVLTVFALGLPPLALLLYELFDAAMAVFTHANLRLPSRLERTLKLVLVTSDMHRIHHSPCFRETDSNYGATLSCWDRIFGTYRSKEAAELAAQKIGLTDCPETEAASLTWLLLLPFRNLSRAEAPRPEPTPETRVE